MGHLFDASIFDSYHRCYPDSCLQIIMRFRQFTRFRFEDNFDSGGDGLSYFVDHLRHSDSN